MHYVYILKSKVRHFFYTGCTDDLRKRYQQHNKGEVVSTKPYRPFDIVYYEAGLNVKDAYLREKYLKSRLGKSYLKKRLKNWFEESKKEA